MRAILEFELPEDREEFNVAAKGKDLWLCLLAFDNELRRRIKAAEDPAALRLLQEIREGLVGLMESYSVDLDMMG